MLSAPFARHLSGGIIPGDLRLREDQLQPDQPRYRSSDQVLKVDADTGEEVPSDEIMKGYKVDSDTYIEVTKDELQNIALDSTRTIKNGLMGTLLRHPYEVRSEDEYFDDIQDVRVTKDMLDLAKHIVNQKSATFDPEKFEDHYETALAELINQKRSGKPIAAKVRPKGENVFDLMDALKRSIANDRGAQPSKGRKPRKAAAGQKEMLLPISGKRAAKAEAKKTDKPAVSRARKRA
jgi:non-homologous end joining protein Ku